MPEQCSKYQQRRFSSIHAYSWAINLERFGFTNCMFRNCQFMALDIDAIATHHTECSGGGSNHLLYMCSVCDRGTDEEYTLNNHYFLSHPEEAQAKGISAIVNGKTMPKIVSKVRKKSWEEFLERKGYIKCLIQNCLFITDDIKVMESHFNTCSSGKRRGRMAYACKSCRGITDDIEFFKRHSKRCVSKITPLQTETGTIPLSVSESSEIKSSTIVQWKENITKYKAAKCPRDGCKFVDNSISALSKHFMKCQIIPISSYSICHCGAWLANLNKLTEHQNSVHKAENVAPFMELIENNNVNNILKSGDSVTPAVETDHNAPSCATEESSTAEEIVVDEEMNTEIRVKTHSENTEATRTSKDSGANGEGVIDKKQSTSKGKAKVVTPLGRLAKKLATSNRDAGVPVNISVDNQNWTVKISPSVVNGPELTGNTFEDFKSIGLFMRREAENLLTCVRTKNNVFNVPITTRNPLRLRKNTSLPPIKNFPNKDSNYNSFLPNTSNKGGIFAQTSSSMDVTDSVASDDDDSDSSESSIVQKEIRPDEKIENELSKPVEAEVRNGSPLHMEVISSDYEDDKCDEAARNDNYTNPVTAESNKHSVSEVRADLENADHLDAPVHSGTKNAFEVLKPDSISDTDNPNNSCHDHKAAEPSCDEEPVPETFSSDVKSREESSNIREVLMNVVKKNLSNVPGIANNKPPTDDIYMKKIKPDPVNDNKILTKLSNDEIIKSDVFKEKMLEITEKLKSEDPSSTNRSKSKRLSMQKKKLKQKVMDDDYCDSNEKYDFLGFSDNSNSYYKLNHLLSYCHILGITAEVQTYPIHVRYDKNSASLDNKKASNSNKDEGSEQKRSGGTSRRNQSTTDSADNSFRKRKVERKSKNTLMKRNTGKEEFQEFVDTLGETSTPNSKRGKGQKNEESESNSGEEDDPPVVGRRNTRFKRNDSKEKITPRKSNSDGKGRRNNKNTKAETRSSLATPSQLSGDESVASLEASDPKEKITRSKSSSVGKGGRNNKNTKADSKPSLATPSQLSSDESAAPLDATDSKEKITRKKNISDSKGGRNNKNTKVEKIISLGTSSPLSSDESVDSSDDDKPIRKRLRMSVDDSVQINKKRRENASKETPKPDEKLVDEETLKTLENSATSNHPEEETENVLNLSTKDNSDETSAVNESPDPPKRGRGRPKKSKVSGFVEFRPLDETEDNKKSEPVIFSGRTRASRGLVIKSYVEESNNFDDLDDDGVVKRKRGRQKKNPEAPSTSNDGEITSDDLNTSTNSTPGRRTRKPRTSWKHKFSPKSDEDPHKMGTCVNCRLSMSVIDFKKKHMLIHNFLCWMEGDEPLEVNNENAMINWLTRHKKLFPKHIFRCEKCNETKKSVKGFLSHLQFCGKSLEERQKLMAVCPVCGRIMMPSSLEQHRPLCIRKVPSKDDEPEVEEEPQQPLSPRKAARQCLSTIADIAPKLLDDGSPRKRKGRANFDATIKEEDLEASSDDEVFAVNGEISLDVHDAIRELFTMKTKRITKNLKTVWEMSVADGKPLQCPCPSCDFNTPVFSIMNEHYKTCSHDFQGYVCKDCKYCSATEREMIRHIKKVHSEQLVSIKSSNRSHPQKRYDNPPGSNYVPFLKKAEIAFNQTIKLGKFFRPALSWTQEQRNLYFTAEPVFLDYNFEIDSWDLLKSDEMEPYTPEKKESVKFTMKNNLIWHQLKLFETKFLNDDLCVLYTGGPVWGLAWAPGEGNMQYLAISTHLSMHSSYRIGSVHMGPGVIQLWSLRNIDNMSALSRGKIEFEYGFCHDYGGCWALEWCPAGCQDGSRIGILAVATTSGVIPVFVVPTPRMLSSEEKLSKETKHYKVEPTLLLKLSDGINSQCTRLSWSKVKPHRTIVAGFANGIIAIWDLTSQSMLLRSDSTLYPFKTFHAHHSNITGLCLSPTSETYLVSSASDKTVKFWDLNNTASPQCIHRRGLANDVTWMHHWLCAVAVYDESYLTGQTTVALHSIRDYIYQPCSFVSTVKSSAWCVSVCDWLNAIATSYDNGQITIAFAKQHDQNAEKRDQKRKVVKVILETSLFDLEKKVPATLNRVNTKLGPNSSMSTSCLSSSSAKSSSNLTSKPSTSSAVDQCEPRTVDCCTYEEVSEKYGIRFDSDVNFTTEVDGNQPNPIDIYPLMSANKVTWNPNMKAFETLAVGYQSGFVVIPKLTLPQFDQSHIESFVRSNIVKVEEDEQECEEEEQECEGEEQECEAEEQACEAEEQECEVVEQECEAVEQECEAVEQEHIPELEQVQVKEQEEAEAQVEDAKE